VTPWRPLITAVVALALLGVYLWDLRTTETRAILAIQQERVLFLVPSLASELAFAGPDGEVRLVRDPDSRSWNIVEPRALPANDIVVDAFLENLRGARRHALVDSVGEEGMGLANPRRSVTVTFEEERSGRIVTRTLDFGRQPDEFSKVFARVRGEDTAFTVSDWLYRQSGKSLNDVRGMDAVPADVASATSLEVRQRRGTFRLTRPNASSVDWTLEEEGRDPLPTDRGMMDRFLVNLSSATFLHIHDDITSTSAQLGFEPPLIDIIADGQPLLSVGNRIGQLEQFHVRTPGGTVGDMAGSHIIDLFRPPTEWSTRRFVWTPRTDVRSIECILGNTRFTLELVEGEWIFREMPGVPVRQQAVTAFLDGIESLRGTQLLRQSVPSEEYLRHGLHEESYQVRVVDASGAVQGFHFGRTDTREALTHLLRIQDGSLWTIPTRSNALVYRYRADFEERRVLPGMASRTDHVEIVTPHGRMNFQRTPSAWRVTMPGERPTLVPPLLVNDFLNAFEDLEIQSEMISNDQIPAEIAFHFHERDGDAPFFSAGVLMKSRSTGNTILRISRAGHADRAVEITEEQIGLMDNALTELLLAAKARAEQERQ
jgi:hypothetical protein